MCCIRYTFVPVARNTCGFVGHNVLLGCSKCLATFPVKKFGKQGDYSIKQIGIKARACRCVTQIKCSVSSQLPNKFRATCNQKKYCVISKNVKEVHVVCFVYLTFTSVHEYVTCISGVGRSRRPRLLN